MAFLPRPLLRAVGVVAAVVLVTASAAVAQDTAPPLARMEQVIQSHVSTGAFMGTVLVARGNGVVISKGYGMANLELDVPNTPSTKFRLGSITKQFTAAAILLLEERGKLKIGDRLKTYLPDAPMAWDRITIFNVLTHTSGIPNFTAFANYSEIKSASRSAADAVATFRDRPLDFGPGEQYSYSNSGYLVLGAIIERVTGQSYEQFLTENIFAPLGMSDSGYDSNTAIIKRRASGYTRNQTGYRNAGYLNMSIPHAAGALYSTTEDLLKWQRALFGGKVVSKASLERMITPFKNDYGLGIGSTLESGRRVIAHNGGIDGFNTRMAFYPDTNTVVIVLSNVNGPVPDVLVPQLGRLMHGDTIMLTSERKEIAPDAATIAKYVGAYELAPGVMMTVTLEGSQLFAQMTGQMKNPIYAQSDRLFFLKVVDAQIEFVRDSSGRVGELILVQNGARQRAARVP